MIVVIRLCNNDIVSQMGIVDLREDDDDDYDDDEPVSHRRKRKGRRRKKVLHYSTPVMLNFK